MSLPRRRLRRRAGGRGAAEAATVPHRTTGAPAKEERLRRHGTVDLPYSGRRPRGTGPRSCWWLTGRKAGSVFVLRNEAVHRDGKVNGPLDLAEAGFAHPTAEFASVLFVREGEVMPVAVQVLDADDVNRRAGAFGGT